LLLIGAVSGLSPIGGDRADEAFASSAREAREDTREGSDTSKTIAAAPPAFQSEGASTQVPIPAPSLAPALVSVPVTAPRSSVAEVVAPADMPPVTDACGASGTCRLPAKAVEDAALPLEAISSRFAYVGDAGLQSLVSVAEIQTNPTLVKSLYTAVVKGLPFGTQLSKGTPVGKGEWIVALDDLGTVEIAIPATATHPVHARVEVSAQNGSPVVRFPVIVDAKGRIEAKPILTAAVLKDAAALKDGASSLRSTKPVRAEKPGREKPVKVQKEAALVPPQAPKRKAVPAVVKTASDVTSAPRPAVGAVEPVSVTSSIGTMLEGSAGLETFRTFSLLGAAP
jgi:hypothetical protein